VPDCCGAGCGNQTAYFELYRNTAFAIKAVNSRLLVGGPATAQLQWIDEFISFCASNSVPVDFVTSHLYPTDPAVDQSKNGFNDAVAAASQVSRMNFTEHRLEIVHIKLCT
jgi:xylan 1,4-beta-xylosidase